MIEQGKYRITYNGSGLYLGDLQSERANSKPMTLDELHASEVATGQAETASGKVATPVPPPPPEEQSKLAGGKTVFSDFTFRIQDTETNKVKFLYLVILDDGDVKAEVLEP